MTDAARKVCVVTGTRAEYGLLQGLMKGLEVDPGFELQLVATGMHLSPEFGLTCEEIENDGFSVDKKIEILLSSDTGSGVAKTMGVALISFADALNELRPDIIVILGDRYEIFCAAAASMALRIPIAHIHGGERTEGLIDEAIRHAVTKMAHIHFTATETYRKRVIQLGERPDTVFNCGALAVDNIKSFYPLSKSEFEKSINFKLSQKNLLVTYHPVTLEQKSDEKNFNELLIALSELESTNIIFTKSNSDMGGRVINSMIDNFVEKNQKSAVCFSSLGKSRYLSAMFHVDGVIGNSSSGIIEAPYIPVGTINIGNRQKGRIAPSSVIHCGHQRDQIQQAFGQLFSDDWQRKLSAIKPQYGDGSTAKSIIEVLRTYELGNVLVKPFYDLGTVG